MPDMLCILVRTKLVSNNVVVIVVNNIEVKAVLPHFIDSISDVPLGIAIEALKVSFLVKPIGTILISIDVGRTMGKAP